MLEPFMWQVFSIGTTLVKGIAEPVHGVLQTLICAPVVRPKPCPTSSNPALLPSWTVVCPSFILLMMLLLPGWPTIGLNCIHKKKKYWNSCCLFSQIYRSAFSIWSVILCFCVLFDSCLVVNTSTVDWLERLVPEMTRLCVEWDVKLYTLTQLVEQYHRITLNTNNYLLTEQQMHTTGSNI